MALILLDVDGPLADNVGATLKCGNDAFGTSFRAEDADQWDFFKKLWPAPEQVAFIRGLWSSPGFWGELPVVAGAAKAVSELRAFHHDVVFLTSPYESCVGWESARREWLRRSFGMDNRDMIACARKDLVLGDLLVDDKPAHVQAWSERHRREAILFDMAHNRRAVPMYSAVRLATWPAILEKVFAC